MSVISKSDATGSMQLGDIGAQERWMSGEEPRPPVKQPSGSNRLFAGSVLCLADAATFLLIWLAMIPFGSAAGALPREMLLAAAAALSLFWIYGVYPGYRAYGHELLRRRALATLCVCAIASLGVLFLSGDLTNAALIVVLLLGALPFQPIVRRLVRAQLKRHGRWGERAAVLGSPVMTRAISDYFNRSWEFGIIPEGAVVSLIPPSVALIAGTPRSTGELDDLRSRYAEIIVLADLPGLRISGLRPSEIGGTVGIRLATTEKGFLPARLLYRTLECSLAGGALLAATPVLLLAAIAIYCVDPGPVLYRQNREGLGGKKVGILKLRTMYQDADKRLEELLRSDPAARDEWTTYFKLRNDPRILPGIGGILRKTSVDELPQLLNIIRGDMRLVGPRPLPDYHIAAMDKSFQASRRSVTPGLTGLWQISERSAADVSQLQDLDAFYIENNSFWVDIHIILKTFPAVLRGQGAY